MTTTLTTRLKISSWQEDPTREFGDGRKVTRAAVELSDGPDGLTAATMDSVLYYRPDGTSGYVTVMRLSGELDGRKGSFVVVGEGSYDGITASGIMRVMPGSGTEALAGISGSCESVSTHADYPFMPLTLRYELG